MNTDPFKKLAGQSEVIPAQAGILQHATMPVTSGIGNRFPRIHGKRAFILPILSLFILPILTGSVEIFAEAPQSQAWLCMRGCRIVLQQAKDFFWHADAAKPMETERAHLVREASGELPGYQDRLIKLTA